MRAAFGTTATWNSSIQRRWKAFASGPGWAIAAYWAIITAIIGVFQLAIQVVFFGLAFLISSALATVWLAFLLRRKMPFLCAPSPDDTGNRRHLKGVLAFALIGVSCTVLGAIDLTFGRTVEDAVVTGHFIDRKATISRETAAVEVRAENGRYYIVHSESLYNSFYDRRLSGTPAVVHLTKVERQMVAADIDGRRYATLIQSEEFSELATLGFISGVCLLGSSVKLILTRPRQGGASPAETPPVTASP